MENLPYRQAIRSKAKRTSIIKEIEGIAAQSGASVSVQLDEGSPSCRVRLSIGGYGASFSLDGKSHNTAFVVSWFTNDRQLTYPPGFVTCPGIYSVNEFHRAKATGIAEDTEVLFRMISIGLARLAPPMITIEQDNERPFTIKASPALVHHMRHEMDDDWKARESLIHELLQGYGFALLDGDSVDIGLTSAPFISDHNPDGRDLPEGAKVWWFERYQIDDFTETLRDEGEVSFPWGMTVEYAA